MKRRVFEQVLSNVRTRYRTVLLSDECRASGEESRQLKHWLLEQIFLNPDLTACGPLAFETMSFHHNGVQWVAELEAISCWEDDNDGEQQGS